MVVEHEAIETKQNIITLGCKPSLNEYAYVQSLCEYAQATTLTHHFVSRLVTFARVRFNEIAMTLCLAIVEIRHTCGLNVATLLKIW